MAQSRQGSGSRRAARFKEPLLDSGKSVPVSTYTSYCLSLSNRCQLPILQLFATILRPPTNLLLLCCSPSLAFAAMWARTAASKGGAKDPTAAPIAKAANIMSERIELEQGTGDVLLSADGFRAYAHEMIWVGPPLVCTRCDILSAW